MLQFLKKTSRRKSSAGNGDDTTATITTATANQLDGDVIEGVDAKRPENDEAALLGAERYCYEKKVAPETRSSKLSRSMVDILCEQSCICYFVQYLETRNALPLIKFWLDVESFKAAAVESAKGANRAPPTQHRLLNRSLSSDGYDSLSYLSVDCDSLSTNSFSENAFEDTSVDDGREAESRTSQNCTPIPTPLEAVEEVDDGTVEDGDNIEQQDSKSGKYLDVCDMTIMRQSLTDDEKTQICEAGKGEEAMRVPFNSLINSDALRIYRKYLVTNSTYYIDIPATILSAISLALCGGMCSEGIFNDAQQYLVEVLEKSFLNAFLESSFYCKYTLDVLTSDSLTLKDILCSEMALFYFMEYLEQERKRHFLEFYVSAANFKRTFDQNQAQNDAVILYEKYFSLQATCSLNLSDKTRFVLEEQICSPDPANIVECFDLPMRIIERFLEQRYFKGFLKSPLYCRFITELLGKVKMNSTNVSILPGRTEPRPSNVRRGHRKTLSDVTSDSSNRPRAPSFISSQNTLLAMSDTGFQRNRKQMLAAAAGGDIMQIDSRQLYNPDLLWRRNSMSGLTFGRVDSLGRYERDFDIVEPPTGDERWSRNRIKKAVRKLVNLPEDKAQEELAWQVAEMIVKDITNVTMSKT